VLWYPTQAKTRLEWGTQLLSLMERIAVLRCVTSRLANRSSGISCRPLHAPAQCTQGCVDQNGQIHKEGTVLDITQVVVDVLVDGKGPIGAQLP
jgi:hypothetical protein